MHVYLPEKCRSPFLHGVFLFSKVRVLVVNSDGFFALVYSSHLMQNFWNFKAIPDIEIILTSIQSVLILKKFKWFLWRGFQKRWKPFVLLLVKNMKWHLVGQKSLRFNLRVSKNQSSKHSFYLHKWWFGLHEKALLTDPDCLPLIRKGLIKHIM